MALADFDGDGLAADRSHTFDVLANDAAAGASHDTLTLVSAAITGVQGVATPGGSLVVSGNRLVFDPGADFTSLGAGDTATVTVTYQIEDATGATATATATITLRGGNRAPEVPPENILGRIFEDSGTDITLAQLLAGISDADADALTVLDLIASSGTVIEQVPGLWWFTPAPDATAPVVFTYTVSDGTATVAATAQLFITPTNDPPTVADPVDLGALQAGTSRTLTADQLLAGASDADGDLLTIVDLTASSGVLAQVDAVTWTFTADPGDDSAVTFSYLVSDGDQGLAAAQTATLDLTAATGTDPVLVQTLLPGGLRAMQAEGAEYQVNTTTANTQRQPVVIGTDDGGHVIVWGSESQDGSLGGIYGQRHDATGTPIGPEFPVNTHTDNQ